MKIYTDGARHWGAQLPRIEEGFKELGHQITPHISDADLIYSNNPWWDQIIKDKEDGNIKGKIILNVLDIPIHLEDYNVRKLQAQLHSADAITAISRFTNESIQKYCGLDSKIIYNPVKPVSYDSSFKRQLPFRFAHIGRRYDPNKRFYLGCHAMQILGYSEKDIGLVGNEGGWGNYVGVLTDKDLNTVYNSVDFVFATVKIAGLELTPLEAAACGAIPVICNDLTTITEFFPESVFPEYYEISPNPESIVRFLSRYLNNPEAMQEMKWRLINHFNKNWSNKLSGYCVAKSIINIYDSIK